MLRRGCQEGEDESLVVAACEAMPILAHAMGVEAYAPVFAAQHAESLLRFLRASQPLDVRSAAVGAGLPKFSKLAPPCRAIAALASWVQLGPDEGLVGTACTTKREREDAKPSHASALYHYAAEPATLQAHTPGSLLMDVTLG